MDASVVISAIHRHICHTVNIVNVIYLFIYLFIYFFHHHALGNLSPVFGYGQVFFLRLCPRESKRYIYLFRNSSTLEVIFDDRLLFLYSHVDENCQNLTYICGRHRFKSWFSNKKSTSYVTMK